MANYGAQKDKHAGKKVDPAEDAVQANLFVEGSSTQW